MMVMPSSHAGCNNMEKHINKGKKDQFNACIQSTLDSPNNWVNHEENYRKVKHT
jgi:hypothetical protein